MNIQGQSAFVTGGGSGLGEAVARELTRLGAKVTVFDRNAEGAQRVADAIGGLATVGDVADSDNVTAALDAATAAHGVPRIVMNVAGIGKANRIVQKDGTASPLEDFERVLRVNLVGTYNVARLCVVPSPGRGSPPWPEISPRPWASSPSPPASGR